MVSEDKFVRLPSDKEGKLEEDINVVNIKKAVPINESTITIIFMDGTTGRYFLSIEEFHKKRKKGI